MNKQNELELANTVFKIQPNKADSFFCFLLFVQSFNCLYLWNQLPNLCGVFTKLKPKQYPNRKCQKNKNHIFRLQTHFAWLHDICDVIKQNESELKHITCFVFYIVILDTQQDYYSRRCGTSSYSYCTSTYTEVIVLLLWGNFAVTMEYPHSYSVGVPAWVLQCSNRATSKKHHCYFSVGANAVTV